MADILLDQKINMGLKKVLSIAKWMSPVFLVTELILIECLINFEGEWIYGFIAVVVINNITVVTLVCLSGWVFRQSLQDYFEGKFIFWVVSCHQVQVNVLVICVCFFVRFGYDFVRILFSGGFNTWRCNEANNSTWGYGIVLATFFFITEYLPILMFLLNLKYVFNQQASLKPKDRKSKDSLDGYYQ